MLSKTSTMIYHPKQRSWWPKHECVICKAKAIGVNFGAPTCAPCKAFFRRNARRREIFESPCPFQNALSPTDNNEQANYCLQVRFCSSCRLRRCFDMGMKEELVRTDEENERYRQLIEINRQRRRQLLNQEQSSDRSVIPKLIVNATNLLTETDWSHLSNIVSAYDNYCLKIYIQRRTNIFNNQMQISENESVKINHHASMTINNMTSFISFLLTIPAIQSLPAADRIYLCKQNIRPLILLNLHELDQLCFSEPWQLNFDNLSSEYVCGNELFSEFVDTRNRAEQVLITDPVVTRLWLLILFISTSLYCYYDQSSSEISQNRRLAIMDIQHSYVSLLWNYLSHRHGDIDAIRIFSNLTSVYLRIQRISQAVNTQIRARNDLLSLHEAFSQAVIIDSDKN